MIHNPSGGAARHRPRTLRRAAAVATLAGLGVLGAAGPASADPPENGSFEAPDIQPPHVIVPAGSTDIPGWTVVSGDVDVWENANWQVPDGAQGLDLSGNQRGVIRQAFDTTAGVGYTISWSYGALIGQACPGGERTATFSVEGSAVIPMAVTGISATDPNWQVASTTFTGTGGPVTLQFADTTTGIPTGCGLALDNVQIGVDAAVPVVEPRVAAGLLGAAGLGAMAWFALRRRNNDPGAVVAG
jgi:hypothetical protein